MIWSGLLLAVLMLNAACEIIIRALHLGYAFRRKPKRAVALRSDDARRRPVFVSVHVATHNEPPALVIATLQSLACSRFSGFEVIILDNNTADPALWQPVAAAAARLGPRFKFFHLDGMVGAKAGALNAALARSDARTTHVAVVDADYQTSPAFIDQAIAVLTRDEVDYVQFPQAYRGVSVHALGVERELGDYFAGFAGDAGGAMSMLPTGTLSMFDIAALRAIGGWSSASITEDAEIGMRLQAAGYCGRWIGREQGHGLLPLDFDGLRIQRARWAAGNFQVLRGLFSGRALPIAVDDLLRLIVQLTAWLSLLWLPAVALVVVGILPNLPLARPIGSVAAATICLSVALTAVRMAVTHREGRTRWASYLPALAAKQALIWTSATAWLPALFGRRLQFRRTQKQIVACAGGADMRLAGTSAVYAAIAVIYLARAEALAGFACVLLAAVWPCAMMVDRALRMSARLNPELA